MMCFKTKYQHSVCSDVCCLAVTVLMERARGRDIGHKSNIRKCSIYPYKKINSQVLQDVKKQMLPPLHNLPV